MALSFTCFTKWGGDCEFWPGNTTPLCHPETAVLISQADWRPGKGPIIICLTIPKYAFASVWCGSKHYSNVSTITPSVDNSPYIISGSYIVFGRNQGILMTSIRSIF